MILYYRFTQPSVWNVWLEKGYRVRGNFAALNCLAIVNTPFSLTRLLNKEANFSKLFGHSARYLSYALCDEEPMKAGDSYRPTVCICVIIIHWWTHQLWAGQNLQNQRTGHIDQLSSQWTDEGLLDCLKKHYQPYRIRGLHSKPSHYTQ